MVEINGILLCFLSVFSLELIISNALDKLNCDHLRLHGRQAADRFKGFIDEEGLARINAYTLDQTRWGVIQKTVSDLFFLGLLLGGALPFLDRQIADLHWPMLWTGLLFFTLFGIIFFLLDLPFDYIHTFVIEEKYGFNQSGFSLWVVDHIKSALISLILLGIVIGLTLWAIQAFPRTWFLLAIAITSGFQIILLVLYPIVIAPLFNRFEPLKDDTLAARLVGLLEQAGLRIKEVCQMDAGKRSRHTNAYFTGLGKTKRVVLFDTLIERHTHEEIMAILAHEAGHFRGKHILKQWAMVTISMSVVFYLTYRLMEWPLIYSTFGFETPRAYAGLLLVGIFWQKAGFFLKPLIMAVTRRWEREADRFAVRMLRRAEPLALALKRVAADNLANLVPHPLYVWFNASHPPIGERVSYLERGGF